MDKISDRMEEKDVKSNLAECLYIYYDVYKIMIRNNTGTIDFNCLSTRIVILCQELRELHTLNIFYLYFLYSCFLSLNGLAWFLF